MELIRNFHLHNNHFAIKYKSSPGGTLLSVYLVVPKNKSCPSLPRTPCHTNRRSICTPSPCPVFQFSWLVLDMSCVSFTDTASTRALLSAVRQYRQLGVRCCLTGCPGQSYRGSEVTSVGRVRRRDRGRPSRDGEKILKSHAVQGPGTGYI